MRLALTTLVFSLTTLALSACAPPAAPSCAQMDAAAPSRLNFPDGVSRAWPQPMEERALYTQDPVRGPCPTVPPALGATCRSQDRIVCNYTRTCAPALVCSCGGLSDDWSCDAVSF